MTDIILPATVKAQYVRFTPSGLAAAAPAYGSGTGMNLVSQRNAVSNFNVSAIEIYKYRYSANLNIIGGGADSSISIGETDYTMNMTALHRSVAIDDSTTLTFNPGNGNKILFVYRDGLSQTLTGANNNELTLDALDADTEIIAVYAPKGINAVLTVNADALTPNMPVTATAYVRNSGSTPLKAKILAVIYNNGTLEWVDFADSDYIPAGENSIFDLVVPVSHDVSGKTLKLFLWDGTNYIPLCEALTIN